MGIYSMMIVNSKNNNFQADIETQKIKISDDMPELKSQFYQINHRESTNSSDDFVNENLTESENHPDLILIASNSTKINEPEIISNKNMTNNLTTKFFKIRNFKNLQIKCNKLKINLEYLVSNEKLHVGRG